MTRPPASVDPLQRARVDAQQAVAEWLLVHGFNPQTVTRVMVELGYSRELACAVAEMLMDVAAGSSKVTLDATWPHAKRAYRPRTEDGRGHDRR